MPYKNTYQLAITFEVDQNQYVVTRNDFTCFEWISNIGGLSFLFNIGTIIASLVDDPSVFVTASMFAQGRVHSVGSNQSGHQ